MPMIPVQGPGVLDGLLVIDFTQAIAGPIATRLLAEMGARVIKIESPRGDFVRGVQWREDAGWAPMFGHGSAGKESVCVDMRKQQGLDIVERLLAHADIVVENFRPGVMERWGFDPARLVERGRLPVVCSVSGFGRGTEQSGWSATDPLGQAFSGMTFMVGEPGGTPYLAANGIADTATAMSAAAAILGAVIGRMRDGKGRYLDLSMADVMLAMDCVTTPVAAAHGDVQWQALGHDHPAVCPFGVFRAQDGFMVIQGMGRGENSTWGRLCLTIGEPGLLKDLRCETEAARLLNRDLVNGRVAAWVLGRSREEAVRLIQNAGGLAGPVHSPGEAVTHDYYRLRGSVLDVAREEPGLAPVKMIGLPQLAAGLSAAPMRPPMLGENTDPVLRDLLGVSDMQLSQLHSEGVVHTRTQWP